MNRRRNNDRRFLTLARRALRLLDKIEATRPAYAQLDELTLELLEYDIPMIKVGKRTLVIEDRFAKKNTSWKSTPFRRFEVAVLEPKPRKKRGPS